MANKTQISDQALNTTSSPSFAELDVDSININGNTISSTNVNGNIVHAANGTGEYLFGSSTPIRSALSTATYLQVATNSTEGKLILGSYFNSGIANGELDFRKSRSTTIGTFVTTVNGDQLGAISAYGDDGAAFSQASRILFKASGAVSSGIVPGQIQFQTTNTSGTLTTALTISNAQVVTLANALPVTSGGTGLTSTTANQLLYSSATSTIAGLATANNGVLVTNGSGVPSISSTIPSATQANITALGTIGQNLTLSDNPAATRYVLLSNSASTGKLVAQAGSGSASFGGAINLFGNSHATNAGWVTAGISSGSGGKFSVNTQALGAGTDVFTVDVSGNVVANGSLTTSQTAGIIGTTTNNDAAAGSVGQLIETIVLVGSAVAMTSTTSVTIASVSLTAGDWDVWGEFWTSPASGTITTKVQAAISLTNNTLPTAPATNTSLNILTGITSAGTESITIPVASCRQSLSGTTTIYLVANTTFSVSTMGGYGKISARRRR